jgi:hypothetical protein
MTSLLRFRKNGFSAICASRAILFAGIAALPLMAGDADDAISPDASHVKWDFSEWCQVGEHRFIFEKTNLGDIIRAFGIGKISRTGDAGAAVFEWEVRYRLGNETVTFMSNNDMGGTLHDLEEVDVMPWKKASDPDLPIIHGPISFPVGEPGMSFQALQHLLGPARLNKGYAEYLHVGHQRGMSEGKAVELDVQGWLRVKVVDGNNEQMAISHVTSY